MIENRVLHKAIRGSLHLLRKPPAIDATLYDRYRRHFDALEITDTETGVVYRITANTLVGCRSNKSIPLQPSESC
jgi:hypothetical protein